MGVALALPGVASAAPDLSPELLESYVRGRLAEARGDSEVALDAYARLLAARPDSADVAGLAYRQAVDAGDRALALKAARRLDAAAALPADAPLLLLGTALERRDWREARAWTKRISVDGRFAFLSPLIDSWIDMAQGRPSSLNEEDGTLPALTRRYLPEQLALQLIRAGRLDAARERIDAGLFAASPASDASLDDLRLVAAGVFARDGRKEAALAWLPEGRPELADARADVAEGRTAGAPAAIAGPVQALAWILMHLAGDLEIEKGQTASVRIARLASFIDPGSVIVRLTLANSLMHAGRPREALRELDRVPPESWLTDRGVLLRMAALAESGDGAGAVDLARTLASGDGWQAELRLGQMLIRAERAAEAAAAFRAAIAEYPGMAPWNLHLLAGAALEQGGDWRGALPYLRQAVALAPDEPQALNYLGYLQIENRQNLPAALAMLRRASALRPDDPAITDSLGWALHLTGDNEAALPLLSRAASAAPANGVIQEHLGDALWSAGRRFEARYAWRAALIQADDKAKARLNGKIDYGWTAGLASP